MKGIKRSGNRLRGRTPKGFMCIVVSIALGVSSALTQEAAAQDGGNNCADVIRLSRQTQRVIQNREHVENHAKSFCDEYSKRDGSSRSRSYSASYKFFSGSMSGSRASESEVASKYCSSDAGRDVRSDAYDQYLTTFPPGTFDAYQACLAYSNKQIRIRLEGFLEHQMTVAVASTMEGKGFVTMDLAPSDGITCRRSGANDNEQLKWEQPRGTSVVNCKREISAQKGMVTLYSQEIPNSSLTLPWTAYQDGQPVDSLRDLQQQLATLGRDVRNVNAELESVNGRIRNLFDIRTIEIVVHTPDQYAPGWKDQYDATYAVPPTVHTLNNDLVCGQGYEAVSAWHNITGSHNIGDFLHRMNIDATDEGMVKVEVSPRAGKRSGYVFTAVRTLCRLNTE